jgi:hypothetical protein
MKTKTDLIEQTESGLYCPEGDFFIDPWRPVERAVITHAHADHARPGCGRYLATPECARLIKGYGGTHKRGTANKFTPETASVAGRRPHENGTAHKWTSEEARTAGRKGGIVSHQRRRERRGGQGQSQDRGQE